MSDFKSIFENDWSTTEVFLEKVIKPVFGDYKKGYDILTESSEIKEKVSSAGIEEIKHCASLDLYGNEIKIFDITVSDNKRLEKNRVGIQYFIRQYVGQYEGSLLLFHHKNVENREWRLSYIEKKSSATEITSAKRYTYILGKGKPARTIVERFQALEEKKDSLTLQDLTNVFSVETLTKQFYKELFNWYEWACSIVRFPEGDTTKDTKGNFNVRQTDKNNNLNLIRLITRLMFVWFIKQKDLIPEWIFDTEDLEKVLSDFEFDSESSGNYYNAIIQNLFFATLNKKINERAFADDATVQNNRQFGIKSLYRDNKKNSFFKETNRQIIDRFRCVPFLNGGLFECLDKLVDDKSAEKNIQVFTDGFSRDPEWMAFVPNTLFWHVNDGRHEGIINIFKRYNFTVEENTPQDVQVALDPELLGNVFENLLGTYNPETSETARKDSGSFYTPREIVNYIVDESLKNYLLHTVNNIDNRQLALLFEDGTQSYTEDNKNEIVLALKTVKILDPACGSGAFPMGALQRMILLIKKCGGVADVPKEIYKLKLNLIENCLFGVDIQPIAVQICKLRFFISLICEQEKTDSVSDNYGFNPLPNLETKFVAANTLIGKKKKGDSSLFDNPEIDRVKKELQEKRHEHFSAQTAELKAKYRKEDMILREKLAALLEKDSMCDREDAKQLAIWNPYDQNGQSSFFDPEWMFGIKDGFDIIIGNPPYISTKGVKDEDKKSYEVQFGFSDDTYNLFTFKGLALCKENGTLNFIIPKTFWTTQTKRNMRNLILTNTINYIFDTANPFESAMVDTCVMQVQKCQPKSNHKVNFLDGSENLHSPKHFSPVEQAVFKNTQNSVIFKPTEYNLRIYELYGQKVKELYIKWWDKIKTSKDIAKNKVELEAYRKSLKPGDIALLGCLTEGGQGLATANNGKYIAVRKSTKWAENIIASRPKKLAEAIKNKNIKIDDVKKFNNEKEYLNSLNESQIAKLFDDLKEKYGRDIFGQGYIYKIIDDSEVADVDKLSKDEKENGIDTTKKYWVPYDKGDKDGNRWYLETPFAIAWSKENVEFLKTDMKARYQGSAFYFREGFCWNNILNPKARLLKVRLKQSSVNDVGAMTLTSVTDLISNTVLVGLLNSNLLFNFYREFINCSVNIQINDLRLIPIIIPTEQQAKDISMIVEKIKNKKKKNRLLQDNDSWIALEENNLDGIILNIYHI